MAAPATTGQLRTSLKDMQIGDYITCSWASAGSGVAPTFSELGTSVKSEGPVTGNLQGSAGFYLVKADKGLLIADRVVQHSISWDTLNMAGYIQGKPFIAPKQIGSTLNINLSDSASSFCFGVFNGDLHVVHFESNAMKLVVKKLGSSDSWTLVTELALGVNASYLTSVEYSGKLYVFYIYNSKVYGYCWDGSVWTSLGCLNYDTSKNVPSAISVAVCFGRLYVAWCETNGSGTSPVRCKNFDGTTWSVDTGYIGSSSTSANFSANSLKVFNNELYLAHSSYSGSYYLLRIFKLSNATGSWAAVDGGTSLNNSTTRSSSQPSLGVVEGKLYVTWVEFNGTADQVAVKQYGGGTTWTLLASTLNINGSYWTSSPTVTSFGGFPCVLWIENYNSIKCKKFVSGTTWVELTSFNTGHLLTNKPVVSLGNGFREIVYNGRTLILCPDGSDSPFQLGVYALGGGAMRSLGGGCGHADASGNPSATNASLGAAPTDNEWDTYIVKSDLGGKITAGDDNVWHWNISSSSWCQETPYTAMAANTYRIRRGYSSGVKNVTSSASSTASTLVSFRPVFEYDEEGGSLWQ